MARYYFPGGDPIGKQVTFDGDDQPYEIVGLVALQHSPHRLDVFGSPSPITADREITESEPFSAARTNSGCCRGDLAGHKPGWTKRRFMIEQNPGAGEESVTLAIIGHQRDRRRLGYPIGALRPKRGPLVGRMRSGVAKAL